MNSPNSLGGTLPEPPFAPELLAAYDAQALPAAVADHITRCLPHDPRAQRILDALAATRAQLRAAGTTVADLPPAVDERLQALLDDLGNISP